MSLHTVSNQVFRFLQTNSNVITTTDSTGNTIQDVTDPTIIDTATQNVLKNFIDNTAVLSAVSSNTDTVSEQELLSDLQNYVKTSGSNITGIINFEGDYAYITFPDDSKQVTGFTDRKDSTLAKVDNQTKYITSDTNGNTFIPSLNVNGQLNINDGGLAINKISNLQSTIDGINSSLITHTDQITTINNTIPIIENNVSVSQTDIINMKATDVLLQNQITHNTNSISSNTYAISVLDTKRIVIETLNAVQDRDIYGLQTHIGQLQNQADTSTFNIASNTVNIAQNTSNIAILQNDVSSINSHLVLNDTKDFNLQSQITQNNSNTLAKFSQIDNNILINSNGIQTCNQNILNNTNNITTINSQIAAINQNIVDIQALDASLQSQVNNNITSIDTINNTLEILPVHSNQLLSLENANILIGSEIANIFNTTQPNINAFNRLNISYLADGSIVNNEFQTLSGIDTTQTIQHQLNGMKSQISVLSNLEDIDISSIVNLQSNIVTIQSALDTLNNMDNSQATFNNNVQQQVTQNSSSIANNNTDIINLQNINTTQHTLNIDFQDQITTNKNLSSTINVSLLALQNSVSSNELNISGINTLLNSSAFTSNINFNVIQGSIATNTSEIQDNRADINDILITSTNIQNNVSDLTARITDNDNLISSITIKNNAQDVLISTLNSSVTTINAKDLSHDTSIASINTSITTINAKNNLQDASIATNTTDITNLKVQNVSQATQNTNTNNAITANNTSINTINDVTIPAINSNIVSNTANITTLINTSNNQIATNTNTQAQIIANTNNIASMQGRLTTDEGNILNNTVLIAGLTSGLQTSNNNISTINEKLLIDENNISNLQTASSINTGLIALKQNIINVSNKLISSNVDYSVSPLQYVDISSPLQANLNSINNSLASNATNLTTINTNLNVLNNADILHSSQIASINNNLTTITSSKQNNINSTNLLDSSLVFIDTLTSPLSNVITLFDTELATLSSTKQNNINNSNKLLSSYVDYTTSPLQHVDITSPLTSTLTGITNAISTLQGLQAGDMNSFADIDHNFDVVDASIATKQNIISSTNLLDTSFLGNGTMTNVKFDYLKNINMDVQSQINSLSSGLASVAPSVSYNPSTQITTITNTTNLNNLTFPDNSSQTTAYTSVKDAQLISSNNKLTNVSYNPSIGTSFVGPVVINSLSGSVIDTVNNSIALKQDQITSSSKLPSSFVDYGASPLQYVDISSGLSSALTGINNNISALQSYDSSQTVSNTAFASSIASLNSSKQNIISPTNKIDASYIGLGSVSNTVFDYIKNLTSDVQSQINSIPTSGGSDSASISTINDNISTIQSKQDADGLVIASNTASLNGINTRLITDESNITSLMNSRTTHDALLTSHTTSITAINARLTTDESNITNNTNSINTISGKQITDEASIASQLVSINGILTRLTTDETNIATTTTNLNTVTTQQINDQASITAINNLLTNAYINTDTNLNVMQGAITANTLQIQDNTSWINGLLTTSTNIQNGVSDLTARVNNHDDNIATINTVLTTLPTLTNNNTFTETNTFSKGIIGPSASIIYTAGMIGYTAKVNGNKTNFAITSNQIATPNNTAISIGIGVYIVCLYINSQPSNHAGTVNFLTTGLSTSNTAYVDGIPAVSTMGTFSFPATTNSRITGSITQPLTVTTSQTFYQLMNCTFSGTSLTLTLLPSACFFTYTRIA